MADPATDPLTGLRDAKAFAGALAAARATRASVAVLVADVDDFAAFNERRGRQAGDRALREVASAMAASLRRGDELFRVDGDAFAALVGVGEQAEALEAARRLRAAAAAARSVTVSIGIALPRGGEPDAAGIARAERALQRAQQGGRDGVVIDA